MEKLIRCTKLALEDSDSDVGEEIALGLVRIMCKLAKKTKKKPKRLWVYEWRKNRKQKGLFAFLTNEQLVTDNSNSYRIYLGMEEIQFKKLVDLITPDLYKPDNNFKHSISVAEKLAVTLRFLVSGESYRSMNYSSMLSTAFFCKTVPIVCDALYRNLREEYLKFPTSPEEWESIAKEFAIQWQFPNCIGALGSKHISFRPPQKYKTITTNNVTLLALVDAHYKFIFIDVGCNDQNSDAAIWQQSDLNKVLDEEINIPKDCLLGRSHSLPHVVIADDAFPLHKHIMKPYPYNTNCLKEKMFNIQILRARHTVQHSFEMLSNRFRILKKMKLKMESVPKIVLACCVLHNFFIQNDSTYCNTNSTVVVSSPDRETSRPPNTQTEYAEYSRKQFSEYLTNEDWQ